MGYDYDVVVIGGGAAGLVAATASAGLGAKTALIEKNKLGGDCTWNGCIPSKTLLKSAQVFSLLKRGKEFGIGGDIKCTPDGVMAHVRDTAKEISTHHAPGVFEERGIKLFFGEPKFIDGRAIEINGSRILSKRFIICTGSRPLIPDIEGLEEVGYLTNKNIFDLQIFPESIAVLGAGPIGVEISQAFSRLGTEVSIIETAERILLREDKETADVLADTLLREGVKLYTGKKAVKFSKEKNLITIILEDKDKKYSTLKTEKVLVAAGRQPNVAGLDLEKAGVKYSNKGIEADDTLKTTAGNIYVCGDAVGPYQFSHMAEYQAIIAVFNSLFPFKRKVDYRSVPWGIFTEPELAHLGLTEKEASRRYGNIKVYKAPYAQNDRAVTDQEKEGFSKVICDRNGYILGAHIIGAQAGEIIHEYVLAKSRKLKLKKLSSAIHIYPTLSQVVKRSADEYYLNIFLNIWVKRISKFFIGFLR
ncbi:MAG: FAD-dependent oxidoreductase [Candidatus Omnitrophica bacterium]|nr:FAD-dependent oxidoreductase [Candidatus Omnitrophota bacterium]